VAKLDGPWFGIDDEIALRAATTHLIELGHHRIAYIGGREDLSTGASRIGGFRRAYQEAGLDLGESLQIQGDTSNKAGAAAFVDLMGCVHRRQPSSVGQCILLSV